MTINELVSLLVNQISALNVARTYAQAVGDVQRVIELDGKILETQATLDAVRPLAA